MEFGLLGPVSLVITDVAWFTGAIAHPTSAPACPTAVQRLLAMKSAIRLIWGFLCQGWCTPFCRALVC
jgi:hypothetical protein